MWKKQQKTAKMRTNVHYKINTQIKKPHLKNRKNKKKKDSQ